MKIKDIQMPPWNKMSSLCSLVMVIGTYMICVHTAVTSSSKNCRFNVTDLGCPVYDYTDWECLKYEASCPEGTEYHCLRLQNDHSRYADGCAQSKVCLKGEVPYWAPSNDGIPTHIICDWCHDIEYFNPESRLSSTYSHCPYKKVKCDYYHGIECFPENKNDIHKQDRLCRCDARNNYVFGNSEKLKGEVCTSNQYLTTDCIRVEPCKNGQERLLNYTCVNKCKNGFRSNTSDECRPFIEATEKTGEPFPTAKSRKTKETTTSSTKIASSPVSTITSKVLPTLQSEVIQTTITPNQNDSTLFPKFTKVPQNVTAKAGSKATLVCAAEGQPKPYITWQKDGGFYHFPAAQKRWMHVFPQDDHYYILDVKSVDEGVYSCIASNDAGSITANLTLSVLQNPSFVKPMEHKECKVGSTTVLECLAEGSPQPKLTWYHNGKELVPSQSSARHFFTAENQLFVIVETDIRDAGEYTCVMSNTLGTMLDSLTLTVITSKYSTGESSEGRGFGLDNESTITGIIIIAAVCCVVGMSPVLVIIIYQICKQLKSATEIHSSKYMLSDKESGYESLRNTFQRNALLAQDGHNLEQSDDEVLYVAMDGVSAGGMDVADIEDEDERPTLQNSTRAQGSQTMGSGGPLYRPQNAQQSRIAPLPPPPRFEHTQLSNCRRSNDYVNESQNMDNQPRPPNRSSNPQPGATMGSNNVYNRSQSPAQTDSFAPSPTRPAPRPPRMQPSPPKAQRRTYQQTQV